MKKFILILLLIMTAISLPGAVRAYGWPVRIWGRGTDLLVVSLSVLLSTASLLLSTASLFLFPRVCHSTSSSTGSAVLVLVQQSTGILSVCWAVFFWLVTDLSSGWDSP